MLLEKYYSRILEDIGEDISREGLLDTPKRASQAMEYLCSGYKKSLDEIAGNSLFSKANTGMVLIKDMDFQSLCEHHILPFFGKVHIAYIPSKGILGLSKVASIIDMYSKRLQIQERLSQEIAEGILKVTSTEGVAILIEAQHMCMAMRGIQKQNCSVVTSTMLGKFKEDSNMRMEFLKLIE